jgi:hypothetical protein
MRPEHVPFGEHPSLLCHHLHHRAIRATLFETQGFAETESPAPSERKRGPPTVQFRQINARHEHGKTQRTLTARQDKYPITHTQVSPTAADTKPDKDKPTDHQQAHISHQYRPDTIARTSCTPAHHQLFTSSPETEYQLFTPLPAL